MTKKPKFLYHGTSLDYAVQIARDGAILSPKARLIRDVRKYFAKKNHYFSDDEDCARLIHDGGKLIEKCLDNLKRRQNELYKTVVHVSPNRDLALWFAKGADLSENYEGIMLGCEITPEVAQTLHQEWKERDNIFVPNQFDIKTLREVYMTKAAFDCDGDEITAEFGRYSPDYYIIYGNGKVDLCGKIDSSA